MLRKMWCATTALVLCVSAAMAGQKTSHPGDGNLIVHRKPGPPARPDRLVSAVVAVGHAAAPIRDNISHWAPGAAFNNFSKDRNAEFLSWYGFAVISSAYCYYYESASHYCFSEVAANAIPITGTGARVKRITVPLFSSTGAKTNYNVGIYSATPSGLPGDLELAGGSTTASDTELCCTAARTVNVDIKLQAGQKYFVEVTCAASSAGTCSGGWNMENTDFSGAAEDYYHYTIKGSYRYCCSGTTHTFFTSSPWHRSTYYPEQPAAIIK